MRIIGIDYGRKRIGIAVSDDEPATAHALKTLANDGSFLHLLRQIIAEYEPVRLVVGLPKRQDGSLGPMAKEADAFRCSLEKELGIATVGWDERLSTFAATEALKEAGVDSRRQRQMADGVAAAVILQDYLDAKQGGTAI